MDEAELITPEFRAAETPPDSEYPTWWVPGRVLLQQQREIQVIKGKRNRVEREEWVELNPADATNWLIQDGDDVEIQTRQTRLAGVARLVDSVPSGVVATTNIFGQLAVAMQDSTEPDPASNVPGLHIAPARVVKVGAPDSGESS